MDLRNRNGNTIVIVIIMAANKTMGTTVTHTLNHDGLIIQASLRLYCSPELAWTGEWGSLAYHIEQRGCPCQT